MKINKLLKYPVLVAIIFTIPLSCTKTANKKSIRELFSFNIGYDKNELGLRPENFFSEIQIINYYYSNGFYYISDSINNKILKVTETGTPILTIYNKTNYPKITPNTTVSIDTTTEQSEVEYLILYSEYELSSPGLICADIDKNIFAVNSSPLYKKMEDNRIDDEMILKFDKKGNFLYKLGKTGINTQPFGYIIKMINDNSNNLIVIEQTDNVYTIYKYSNAGVLLHKCELSLKSIPVQKNESNYLITFVNIIPGYIEDEVYVTAQFVSKEINMKLETYSIEYEKIFRYSMKQNKIDRMLLKISPENEDLTKYKYDTEIMNLYGNKKSVQKPFQTLLGVDINNNIHLYRKDIPLETITANNYYFMRYNENGALQEVKYVNYPNNIFYNSNMTLTNDTRIVSFIVKEGEIKFITIN